MNDDECTSVDISSIESSLYSFFQQLLLVILLIVLPVIYLIISRKLTTCVFEDDLFKQPPQKEDCPIYFLRLPSLDTGYAYNSCCGKVICSGCIYAVKAMNGNVDQLCPFCRAPCPSLEEANKQVNKRMEVGDAQAIYNVGCCYAEGRYGFPQDMDKALELWHRAAELSYVSAYFNIGTAYFHGNGVERDEEKAKYYFELGAIGGDAFARHILGILEGRAGNIERALKHFMIAAGSGYNNSLKMIQRMYKNGHATKDDYANALRAYQAYLKEIKSDDRDKAAAFGDHCKYYE